MADASETMAHFVRQAHAVPSFSDDAALQAMRQQSLTQLDGMAWPTARHEAWKNTSLTKLAAVAFQNAAVPATHAEPTRGLLTDSDSHRLVFVDGHHAPALSRVHGLPSDVWIGSLQQAMRVHGARLQALLPAASRDVFSTLNGASLQDGACICVPRNTRIERPIEIVWLASGQTPQAMTHPRTIVMLEESAAAYVVETYRGAPNAVYFTNAVTQVVLAANAALEHIRLQDESMAAFHVGSLHAAVPRDARLRAFVMSLGGQLTRQELHVALAGEGAAAHLFGLAMARGTQHTDHHVVLEHAKPHGTSSQLFKAVLDEYATGVFGGKVLVQPHALKTDAKQMNKNILLSAQATVHTRPQLEILADDVKCSHGATVGQLAEEALFYLRSRGISQAEAKRLLTYAFAHDVFGSVTAASASTALAACLQAWLSQVPTGETL